MDYIEEFTCIRFQSRAKNDENYLYFRNLEGKCSSFVGNIRRGPQVSAAFSIYSLCKQILQSRFISYGVKCIDECFTLAASGS